MTPTPILNEMPPTQYVRLVADIASGAGELMAAHARQIGVEFKEDADKATTILGLFSAAGTLIAIGFVCMVHMLTQFLQERFGYTATASWGITGGITFAIGIGLLLVARYRLTAIRWFPLHSLKSLQESLKWITRK